MSTLREKERRAWSTEVRGVRKKWWMRGSGV
jgi:hypothetical protein